MELLKNLDDVLLFAVPKKGRLAEKVTELLFGADITFRRSHRLDIAISTTLPVALVFLPAADIPRFVSEGRCSIGISGQDQVRESEADVTDLLDLEFGRCKLQLQVPKGGDLKEPKQAIGKRVVTSFPKLAAEYFSKLEGCPVSELKTEIKYVGGSVEAAIALGVGDAIVDLVESGDTMRAAGLEPIGTVLETTAHLFASKSPSHPEVVETVLKRIGGFVASKKYVLCNYNARRENLSDVLKLTPGRRAATVSPLDNDAWCAVSSMVLKKDVAQIMDQLQAHGAEDILVISLDNCRT